MKDAAEIAKPVEGTRRIILDIALSMFASQGFESVSMRALAAEVGINPATLYHHFKDKESLYVETLEEMYQGIVEEFVILLKSDMHPWEKFRIYVRKFCRFCAENQNFIKLIKREQLDGDPVHMRILANRFFNTQIQAAMDLFHEILPDHDPYHVGNVIHGTPLHHYESLASQHDFQAWSPRYENPDVLASYLIDLFKAKITVVRRRVTDL